MAEAIALPADAEAVNDKQLLGSTGYRGLELTAQKRPRCAQCALSQFGPTPTSASSGTLSWATPAIL